MAYDEALANRLLEAVADQPDITSRKMFGGFAVMSRGNMLAGVIGNDLMARVGADATADLLGLPGAHEADFMKGRPMKGMLMVDGTAVADDTGLQEWLDRCLAFVDSLPAK